MTSLPAQGGSARSPDFFIFGCERSGTTLLCALLSEHPEICVVNDSFIYNVLNNRGRSRKVRLVYKAMSRATGSPAMLSKAESSHLPDADLRIGQGAIRDYTDALVARYNRRAEGNWMTQYADRLRQFDGTEIETIRQLLDAVLTTLIPEDQLPKRLLGEKTPIHSHMQAWLRATYPAARSVILVRHPITNVAAIFKRRREWDLDRAIALYLSYYDGALAKLLAADSSEVTTLRYEDLVASPQESVGALQQWLGAGDQKVAETFSYFVKQDYVGDRIEPSRDVELRASLDDDQQRRVIKRCGRIIERFYPSR